MKSSDRYQRLGASGQGPANLILTADLKFIREK
jgi:hypothetical protein